MSAGIYIIKNMENSKVYVGSSRNIEGRFRVHKSRLRLNKHHAPHLQKSYNLNPDKFDFQIIEIVNDLSILEQREQYWVDHFQSYKSEFGYNAVRTVSQIDPSRMKERWAKPGAKEAQCKLMKEVCSTAEHRKKLSKGQKKRFSSVINRKKQLLDNPLRKRVRLKETGEVFDSIAEASRKLSVSVVKIRDSATGRRKSNDGKSFEWVADV